jgi:WD40 repeat protein
MVIYNFETKEYKYFGSDFFGLENINCISFSWNSEILAVFGGKDIILYDLENNKIMQTIKTEKEIEQINWFPNDEDILVAFDNKGYKINIKNSNIKPELFLKQADFSKCAFIPGTTKLVMISDIKGGLMIYDYKTKIKKQITYGYDYQPQVSPNGKYIAYISETPYGGFIVKLKK